MPDSQGMAIAVKHNLWPRILHAPCVGRLDQFSKAPATGYKIKRLDLTWALACLADHRLDQNLHAAIQTAAIFAGIASAWLRLTFT